LLLPRQDSLIFNTLCEAGIAMRLAGIVFGLWLTSALLSAYAACDDDDKTDLPLISGNRPVIIASLNGHQMPMLVDTGAARLAVSRETADALSLPPDRQRTRLNTISGTETTQNVLLETLIFGGHKFSKLSATVIEFPSKAENRPAGIIGADLLSQFNVEFDFPKRMMTLYSPLDCAQPSWKGVYNKIPLNVIDDKPLIPVELDGHQISAEFDTGSRGETVAEAAAEQIGVSATDLENDPSKNGVALTGPYAIRRHRFTSFQVAGETFHDTTLDVSPLHQLGIDMLVGADYMHWRRFFLSYSTGALFVQKGGGTNAAAASAHPALTDLCHAPDTIRRSTSPAPPALSRPHLRLPDSIRLHLVDGCAGITFHLGPDGRATDSQIIFEKPSGYGLGDFIRRQILETRYLPPNEPGRLYYMSVGVHIGPPRLDVTH
jgi:hypothetical protein